MIVTFLRSIILVIALPLGIASQTPFDIENSIDPTDFAALQSAMNVYYNSYPRVAGYKHWKRKEWYLQARRGQNGEIINIQLQNSKEYFKYMDKLKKQRATPHGAWLFFGPTDVVPGGVTASMGRLNSIDINPSNANHIYVTSSSGGIWKTLNGGTSWINISPDIPVLSVKDLELVPGNPNIIYALTGDPFNTPGQSIGVIKTTDGGTTWHPTGLSFDLPSFFYPEKLLMHPTNPNIQFVASHSGLYRTADGWNTYSQIFPARTWDIEYKPGSTDTMFCTTNLSIRRSINGGLSWTTLTDSDFVIFSGTARKEIAVTPHNPSCVYVFGADWGPIGLVRSLSSGDNNTWTIQDTAITNLGVQGQYNMGLYVSESNYQHVSLGLVWTKRSTSGGTPGSWSGPTNYVHADVHDIVEHNAVIYHANDGGLFKSLDGGITFTDLSGGLEITEMYRIAGTPQNVNLLYAGNQDNGTFRRTVNSTFTVVTGNDGTDCVIDYTNQDIVYTSSQFGYFYKSTNGGASFTHPVGPPGTGAFISPMLMDPADPDVLFVALDSLWRSDDGMATWTNLGSPLSGGNFTFMAQGTDDRTVIYASSISTLYRTSDALDPSGPISWTNITSGLPGQFVAGITVNPDNANEVYVCLGDFNDGHKVYFSNAGGNPGSWTNISGSLPNVATSCIVFHDNGLNNHAVYLGTDIGVFYRDDSHSDWIYFSSFMPSVRVNDLYINHNANLIAAGTYGRGLWISATYSGCDNTLSLDNIGAPDSGMRYYSSNISITSGAEYSSSLGTNIHYTAGELIDLVPGFRLENPGLFQAEIGPCPAIGYQGLSDQPATPGVFVIPAGIMSSWSK